jgi:DNA polymerase
LGRPASFNLLGKDPATSMGAMRGEHRLGERRVICTYHPAYLLRNPSAKQEVWEDLNPLILFLNQVA